MLLSLAGCSKLTTKKDLGDGEPGPVVTVSYITEDKNAGIINGPANHQSVQQNVKGSTAVKASPKLGYKFVGWSDGVTTDVRSNDSPVSDTTYTAQFDFDALELPVISITTENGAAIKSKETYIKGTITVENVEDQYLIESLDMQIRGRGNYTWGSQIDIDGKVPYKIKLSEKQNLLGQGNGKAKDWTLLADHCDQSLIRNYTTMNFARKLEGISWNSSANSVDLYINGEYRGVYLLCEQNEVNKNRVNITENPDITVSTVDQTGYLLQLSGYAEDPKFTINETMYEIVNDLSSNSTIANAQINYMRNYLQSCWDAVYSGDQTKIATLMDIDSVVDTYIVEELFKNLDAGWDSFFMYKDMNDLLHFGPIWDFDQTGGNADVGCEDFTNLQAGNSNVWYRQLLTNSWFSNLVSERWNELKDLVNEVPASIHEKATEGYNAYCRNFERWEIFQTPLNVKINRETDPVRSLHTYQEQVDYYATWMQNRIDWLDTYWNSEDFLFDATITLSGIGTAADPYLISSAEDFQNLTRVIQTGEDFSGSYFRQISNIDLAKVTDYTGLGANATFAGTYDGNNYSINAVLSGADGCIFPYVTGTVMNVCTTGSITNSAQVGGICRSVRIGGSIVNCSSTMKLSGSFAGGIAASNQGGGDSTIKNCFFGGSVNGTTASSPICCWMEGRTGVFLNNYYLDTVANTTANVSIEKEETALNAAQIEASLADYLNGK
jgi:hypothetical protein